MEYIAHERWSNETKPFADVVDLTRQRHALMEPEDWFTHLNKYAYANVEGRNALAGLRRDSEGNQFLGTLSDHAFDQLALVHFAVPQQPQTTAAVIDRAGQRLIEFMGKTGGHLAHRAHARYPCQFALMLLL